MQQFKPNPRYVLQYLIITSKLVFLSERLDEILMQLNTELIRHLLMID